MYAAYYAFCIRLQFCLHVRCIYIYIIYFFLIGFLMKRSPQPNDTRVMIAFLHENSTRHPNYLTSYLQKVCRRNFLIYFRAT